MPSTIKAIIGLGNPGSKYTSTRHNIGFRILDEIARERHAQWQRKDNVEFATIDHEGTALVLVKPQTFMNSSGAIAPFLKKQNIHQAEQLLVVHDELELPFGTIKAKKGGSARGHNGLKSLIAVYGPEFYRVRFGIDRPERQEDVPDYVLRHFDQADQLVEQGIARAVDLVNQVVSTGIQT